MRTDLVTISSYFEVIRHGTVFCLLEPYELPSITMSSSAAIKTAFSGSFFQDGAEAVNFITDRIRPWLVMNGVSYSCGEFVVTSEEKSYIQGIPIIQLEAYGLCYLIQRKTIEKRLSFPAGSTYLSVIQGLILDCGLDQISADSCQEVLQTDREDWEPGTDYLTIINQLLAEINFQSLWDDKNGQIRLQRKSYANAANISYMYQSGKNSIIAQDCSLLNDIHGKYNVFSAVVENPDYGGQLIATSVNDSKNCPFSTLYIGRVCAPTEKVDNIASQEALQKYVDDVKFQSLLSTEEISFSTIHEPGHGVGDILAINHEYLQGIYKETGWTLYFCPEKLMTHNARKVVYL